MNRQITKSIKHLLLAAFAVVALGISANTASANAYSHINSMAVKIRNKTKSLLRETEHYRYTPNYRHLVSDAAALRQLAEHTREVARDKGDLDHLAADVAEMDQTFHHLENLFDATEQSAAYNHGKIKGNTAHVKRLLEAIEDCIHHIQDDIATLRSQAYIAPPVVVQRPVYVQRPVALQRPVVDPSCPYARSRGLSNQPIVTRVETRRVPTRDLHRQGYGRSQTYGGGGGGFNFSIGGGNSRMHFNF